MTQKRCTCIPKRQKCVDKGEPYIGYAEDISGNTIALVDATGTTV